MSQVSQKFRLDKKVALITGGAGFLGKKHAEAILESGGEVIIADLDVEAAKNTCEELNQRYAFSDAPIHTVARWEHIDVTNKESIEDVIKKYNTIDILINNAAMDPKVEDGLGWKNKFEHLDLDSWDKTVKVILTGTFLCSQAVVNKMLSTGLESPYCRKGGVILNIASDLSVISPDHRIYGEGAKPASYGAAKAAVVNLTKYLATYLAPKNIRVNALSPGGVYNNQPEDFVNKLSNLIPMGRMANADEYKSAVLFLCSEASSYINGENIIMDGGRSIW